MMTPDFQIIKKVSVSAIPLRPTHTHTLLFLSLSLSPPPPSNTTPNHHQQQVKLCSVGYADFDLMAQKFFVLYATCKEQLSAQKHYDWVRALRLLPG